MTQPSQRMVVDPCEFVLGVPLMALKIPRESDNVLLVQSSAAFIWGGGKTDV